MEPRIATIEIACRDGDGEIPQRVVAGVYRYVAVHKAPNSLVDEHRTLTHVATGRAIETGLHRSVAIAIAERIGSMEIWGFQTLAEFDQRKAELKRSYEAALKQATQPQRKGGR